jgi:polysaccharide deacetylase 2 family uncharacterized protein YibQ
VAADDLSAPLGQRKARKRPRALPVALPQATVAALGLFVVIVAGWAMIADDPLGGEPRAIVSMAPTELAGANIPGKKPEAGAARPSAQAVNERPSRYDGPQAEAGAPPTVPAGRTVTIIDGTSGKRQDIVIPATPAEGKPTGLDPRLSEASPHGPLPKVAADGSRASEHYARPVKGIPGKPNAPRIAIVVGGLGIGAAATGDALGKLPGPVTLALTPYGGNLTELAARARGDGHEVLLQVPMEPFDYPDNDPGPQTLLTSLEAGQNIDRLQWLMSRFEGYVGIANFMGARFTSSDASLTPVLREAGSRGLLYFDDGSSQRSAAGQIAGAYNIAFAKADLAIDAVPTPGDVDRALGRLETMARERGVAVGMASALPVSIDRIAKWAKAAEGRGILLVPISAVAKQKTDDRRRTSENKR